MTPQEFKEIRKNKGYTIARLASLIGLNERTVRRYEYAECPIHKPVVILMRLIEQGVYK